MEQDTCDDDNCEEESNEKELFSKSAESHYIAGAMGNYEPEKGAFSQNDSPGENGKPVNLDVDQISLLRYGMSEEVSNMIALNRSVPDIRHNGCRYWHYPIHLPNASVVLVFHNEALTVLLRTVYSIINRSPKHLLEEILLVDDYSDTSSYKDLGSELENKIKDLDKVRLIRNSERQGLIRSKNIGANQSKGEVVVFLDAHCEVNINWLPPLLAPIAEDKRTVSVPLVDRIDYATFEYQSVYQQEERPVGIWEWGFLYKESRGSGAEAEGKTLEEVMSSCYPSPVHAGGLIAVNRDYFLGLGGYDDGLLVWGGEQVKISKHIFKQFALLIFSMNFHSKYGCVEEE